MIEALLLVLKSNVIEIEDKHKYLKRSMLESTIKNFREGAFKALALKCVNHP